MRAALLEKNQQPLVLVDDIDVQDPRAGEVLVKVSHCGICHSDLTVVDMPGGGQLPCVLGHEAAGTIEEVGMGVTRLKKGDRVMLTPIPTCGVCYYCSRNQPSLCITGQNFMTGLRHDGTSPFSRDGELVYQAFGLGGWGEYSVVDERRAVKIDDDTPLEIACVIGCAIQTGVGAVLNTARVTPGSSVAVFGLGTVGLSAVQGAVMAKAERILAVDINPDKWEMAKALGATDFVNPKEVDGSVPEYIQEMTGGGVDYSFECIGNVNVMRDALECTHMGWGTSTIIGVAGAGEEIKTRPFNLVVGRRWIGTAFGGVKGRTELPGMVDQYMDGTIELDSLVTHTMPLEEINTAFDLMHEGKSIKSVIMF